MKRSKNPPLLEAAEKCAACFRPMHEKVAEILACGNTLRENAREMQCLIHTMRSTGLQNDASDLTKLYEHLEMICERVNQMELGGLTISTNHALDAANRRLP